MEKGQLAPGGVVVQAVVQNGVEILGHLPIHDLQPNTLAIPSLDALCTLAIPWYLTLLKVLEL